MKLDEVSGFVNTPIGMLPKEWQVVPLEKVAILQMGQSPPSTTYNDEGIGLPFLQGKAEFGAIYPTPIHWCSQPLREALQGSVLISVRAPVGDVNIAKERYCVGRGLAAINGNELIDNEYLFYFLLFAKPRLEEQGTGSTFKSINKGVLKEFQIFLPPLSEQRAIAHVLTTVHQTIEATEIVIEATQQLKRSLMQYLFNYGPVPLADAEHVLLKETEVGEIPEAWDVNYLGEFANILSGGTPSRNIQEYWNGGIPWVKTGEINYHVIEQTDETISVEGLRNSSARLIPANTLLMAMYGEGVTRGRVAILGIEAAINQACAAIFIPENISQEFLYYYFTFVYEYIRNKGHGAHQKNLSITILKTIPVPLPSLNSQNQIVKLLQFIDNKIYIETKRKNALNELFSSMLDYLVTGKVRIQNLPDLDTTKIKGENNN